MFYLSFYFSEIKIRCFYILIAWILTFLISYFFKLQLVYLISRPFLQFQTKFIFLDLTEAFYTILQISLLISILTILPYCFYQIWSFFIPSRYNFERIKIKKFLLIFISLFLSEIFIIYFIIFPEICEFLLSFEIKTINNLLTVELSARLQSYLNLISRFYIIVLFLFQIPLFFVLFYRNNLINCYDLCKNRKFFIFLSILFSAFISPPDIFSQLLFTFLFFIVYEFLIFIGFFFSKNL